MKTLDFALETKAVDEDGHIEGIVAGYGNVDHGGDLIIPGALAKSIDGRATLPMLLYHDQKRPIGVWTNFSETPDGMVAKGRFALSTRDGQEAHALSKDGALGGLSIGYGIVRQRMNGKIRELHEIKLHEVSLVSIPMNEKAVVTHVKDIVDGGDLPSLPEFEEFLRDVGGFSRTQAKAITSHGLKHLTTQRDAGREVDDQTAFLNALLRKGD